MYDMLVLLLFFSFSDAKEEPNIWEQNILYSMNDDTSSVSIRCVCILTNFYCSNLVRMQNPKTVITYSFLILQIGLQSIL